MAPIEWHLAMKHTSILILSLLFHSLNLAAQNRIIHGRVLSEDLESLPRLKIRDSFDSILGETDLNGDFEISISRQTDSLFFCYLGMESADIKLNEDCDAIEMIMIYDGTYHYRSHRKIDRLRKERYDKIVDLHTKAVQKGIFESEYLCYQRSFVPNKPQLDEIRKRLKQQNKENFDDFKRLQIGQIVSVPMGFDSSGKRVNTYYSICDDCTEDDYEFEVEAELINKRKKHLTLELKILDMNSLDLIEYEGKTLKIGDTFKYQMKYFEVIMN